MAETFEDMQKKIWQEVGIIAIALASVWGMYVFAVDHEVSLLFFAKVLAGVSGIFLAMSFSLGSFSYYWNFLDSKLIYRKYFGLAGYYFALAYVAVAALIFPEIYVYGFRENFFTIDIFLGSSAMAIFTMMAIISNNQAMHILGPQRWKFLLGLGYIAYALLVIRGIFLDQAAWAPLSVRMILTVLGTIVLLFRVSVPFHKTWYNKEAL
jgi:hypothetical protein